MSGEKLIKKRWHSVGHGFGWAHPDLSGTETADHVVDDLYDIIERLNVKIDALEKELDLADKEVIRRGEHFNRMKKIAELGKKCAKFAPGRLARQISEEIEALEK